MCSVQDCFFYSLVFDPVQKTLLADQGEIRVGSKYQAEIPDKLAEGELEAPDKQSFPTFNELFLLLTLLLNVSKTKEMIFDPRSIGNNNVVTINGEAVGQVTTSEYLGVMVDPKLKWDQHVEVFWYQKRHYANIL